MPVVIPVVTHYCRDCHFHCYTPERLAEHRGHDLEASGTLFRILMPTIDPLRPVGIWIHEGSCCLVRHDCPLEDGYPLGELFNDPIYTPPQKGEILRWVDELQLPL